MRDPISYDVGQTYHQAIGLQPSVSQIPSHLNYSDPYGNTDGLLATWPNLLPKPPLAIPIPPQYRFIPIEPPFYPIELEHNLSQNLLSTVNTGTSGDNYLEHAQQSNFGSFTLYWPDLFEESRLSTPSCGSVQASNDGDCTTSSNSEIPFLPLTSPPALSPGTLIPQGTIEGTLETPSTSTCSGKQEVRQTIRHPSSIRKANSRTRGIMTIHREDDSRPPDCCRVVSMKEAEGWGFRIEGVDGKSPTDEKYYASHRDHKIGCKRNVILSRVYYCSKVERIFTTHKCPAHLKHRKCALYHDGIPIPKFDASPAEDSDDKQLTEEDRLIKLEGEVDGMKREIAEMSNIVRRWEQRDNLEQPNSSVEY